MYKNYIFDWSGVIGDDFLACLTTINEMFEHIGAPKISAEDLQREWQQPYMKFYNKRAPGLTKEKQDELFVKYWQKHKEIEPHKGVADLLKQIKSSGGIIIVLTSNDPTMIDHVIEKHGLGDIFDQFYFHVHDKAEKIHDIMAEWKFDKRETCIIGDTPHEVEAGQAAGITTIGVTWGFKDRNALEKAGADYVADDVVTLEKILFGK